MSERLVALIAEVQAVRGDAPLAEDMRTLEADRADVEAAAAELAAEAERATARLEERATATRAALTALRARIAATRQRAEADHATLHARLDALGRRAEVERARLDDALSDADEGLAALGASAGAHGVRLAEHGQSAAAHLQDAVAARLDEVRLRSGEAATGLAERLAREVVPTFEAQVGRVLAQVESVTERVGGLVEAARAELAEQGAAWVDESRAEHMQRLRRTTERAVDARHTLGDTGAAIRATTTGLGVAKDGVATASMAANAGLQTALGILDELLELLRRVT